MLLVDLLRESLLVDISLYEPIAAAFHLAKLGFQGGPPVAKIQKGKSEWGQGVPGSNPGVPTNLILSNS